MSSRILRFIAGPLELSASSLPNTLDVSVFHELPHSPLSGPDGDWLLPFPQRLDDGGCDRGVSLTDVREGCLLGSEEGPESSWEREGEPRGDAMRLLSALLL